MQRGNLERAAISKFSLVYKDILARSEYLVCNCSIEKIRVVSQLRISGMGRITTRGIRYTICTEEIFSNHIQRSERRKFNTHFI